MEARPLTPPEALVLRAPHRAVGHDALPAAARYLLAAGLMGAAPEETRRWWGTHRAIRFTFRAGTATGVAHLDGLLGALQEATAKKPSLTGAELVQHLQKTFGPGFYKYTESVREALAARGLLVQQERRALGLVPVRRWERTAAGESAHLVLEGRLADARTLPELLHNDPQRAAAVAAGLGGLLLAVDELKPHYSRLAEVLRQHGRGDDETTTLIAAGSHGGDGYAGEAAELGLAFDAFASIEWSAALEVFDGAFDVFDFGGADGADGGGD